MRPLPFPILATLLLASAAPLPSASAPAREGGPISFEDGFESGDLAAFQRQLARPGAGSVVRAPVRAGKAALRLELLRTDPEIHRGRRAELVVDAAAAMHAEYWYGLSVYLPDDWAEDREQDVVAQWHNVPDEGESGLSPPLAIRVRGREWLVTNISDPDPITTARPPQRVLYRGPYGRGRWTDFVVRARWSHADDGLVQVWIDGDLVADRRGPVTYNDAVGPKFKVGLYKSGWNDRARRPSDVERRVLFVDEVRAVGPGGGYEAVAPR